MTDMQAVQADFNRALQLHGVGRVAEAQSIYEAVVGRAPGHAGALHLLGVCHFQQGRFNVGVPFVERALAIKPDYAEAHNNLGNGLKALRRYEDAMRHYERALEIQPVFADAHNNLGVIMAELGRPAEALPRYARALALAPNRADILNNSAAALAVLGRHAEAIAQFEKALALQPRYADAHNNLGSALRDLGRHDDALAAFERALAIRPNYPAALYNRGNVLAARHRYEEALASYDQAVALDPNYAQAFNNRGIALQELQRPDEAIVSYDRALALDPGLAEALMNRANTQRDLHRFEAALADYGEALVRRGDYPEATFNRSILHLLRGDFSQGWHDYEQRWRFDKFITRSSNGLSRAVIERLSFANDRTAFEGKRCLVVGEQGVGDEVMFAGLLRDLERDAASVACLCSAKLLGLFAPSFPNIRFIGLREPVDHLLSEFDLVVAAGSLGYVYRRTLADFTNAPYLCADADRVAAWRRRLNPDERPLIGLSWRGGTADTRGANRSLTIEALLPLFDAVDARFVSLQYGDVADELSAFAARYGRRLLQFPRAEIEDFADLAALVASIDKVVSVQTALIHLCGALGKECLTLVPKTPEWRYGLSGEAMPWYGSVRLLRQGASGDWSEVVARAAGLLAAG